MLHSSYSDYFRTFTIHDLIAGLYAKVHKVYENIRRVRHTYTRTQRDSYKAVSTIIAKGQNKLSAILAQ